MAADILALPVGAGALPVFARGFEGRFITDTIERTLPVLAAPC
ncbi:MAG: hypothetical protein ACXU8U_08940 [Asticcacaulis sp.]